MYIRFFAIENFLVVFWISFYLIAFITTVFANPVMMECKLPSTTYFKQDGGSYFMSTQTNWEWIGWCDGKEKMNQRLREKGNTATTYTSMQSINAGASHTCVSSISVKTDAKSSVNYSRQTTIHWLKKYYSANVDDAVGETLEGYPKTWNCEWVHQEKLWGNLQFITQVSMPLL